MRVLIAAIIGLALGAVLITVSGYNPGEAYATMFQEAVGSVGSVADVLGKSTPLLLLGLGFAVAVRAGLFNIGGEGQFTIGAIAAAGMGHAARSLPAFLLVPLVAATAMLAGGLWAWLAGWMRARRNVHEVVSTIMLNYIALGLATYLVNLKYGPLHDPAKQVPQTLPIGSGAILPTLYPRTDLHAGVFLALALVPLVSWFLRRSVMGFEIRAVGRNAAAARTYGIPEGRAIVRAMTISGALAGLAGAMELMGVSPFVYKSGFSAGRGFDGITIALMGGGSPVGVFLASLFLGALRLGATGMETVTGVPNELARIIQGILIIAVSTPVLADWFRAWRARGGPTPTGPSGEEAPGSASEGGAPGARVSSTPATPEAPL